MENISQKLIELANYRIEQEEISSRKYKYMAICLEYHGYLGAAKLWYKYAGEELAHAQWAYDYLLDLDVEPEIPALPKPEFKKEGYGSELEAAIHESYLHEQEVTKQCQDFAKAAFKDGDYMTMHFAQKYLDEQVEELKKTSDWINRLEAFGNSKEALRLLDDEMGG